MNSKIFIWIAAVLALIGLVVNATVDLDNVYDMTTTTLWLLTLVFVALGALLGRKS